MDVDDISNCRADDTPLLNSEDSTESTERLPWEPTRNEYMYTKMKYYRRLEQDWVRLSPNPTTTSRLDLAPPPHVLPPIVFVPSLRGNPSIESTSKHIQSSISTIFSIWNTMIGSTLVSLPYGFSSSGLLLGMGIVLIMGSICCYTCQLIVFRGESFADFGDLVQYYFGRRAQVISMLCSVFVLVGACIAYHVLMQECLYKAVCAFSKWLDTGSIHLLSRFESHWSPTFAAILILAIYPITNLKNVNTLVSLNTFGIPFVCYSMFFIAYHGIHSLTTKKDFSFVTVGAKSDFGHLTGIVTLSFFIHNAIQPIVKNSSTKTRKRDVTIAYCLVGVCYLLVGSLGYIGFAESHRGFEQNYLDSFPTREAFAFSTRLSLFMQLATVYPLVLLIIRTQLFGLLLGTTWPSTISVMGLNLSVMAVSTGFAIFYPKVGDILRFTGAFGGFILIFALPICIHCKALSREGQISVMALTMHILLILVGGLVLILQFF